MLSYRKLAMRVLGRPLHTGGGIDSPRPASQRAAAFVLTAALLTGAAFPAFAGTYYIEEGDITISAGTVAGTNKVEQGGTLKSENDKDTVITNQKTDTASSNTVTIDAGKDKVEVTLKDVNIDASSRKEAAMSVTGSGNTTIKLDGDNHLTGGNGSSGIGSSGIGSSGIGSSGIDSIGSLTIYGGENDSLTAKGGSGADGYGGKVGGYGICSFDRVAISGGTVEAAGGNGSTGGDGISSSSGVTVSDGTVTATGGNSTGSYGSGGDGIRSDGGVTISGGTVKAAGGDSKDGYGGDGIRSDGGVTISGNTVNAAGGNGGKVGGDGIRSDGGVTISGGTVEAAGGVGKNGSGGSGIYSSGIDLSGSLELTAKAGSPNGKALSQNGKELGLNTIKDKLGPGAKVTTTDADGKVIDQVPIPRPVEPEKPVIPEDSSSSSDGGSSAPSAPTSPLPGLTVTDKDGQRISYTSTQSGNTLTVCVGRFTASLRASLSTLRQLRAEGIDTITFQTILCSTTLSVDELLAMGGEDAEAVLTHRSTDSSLTVG